MNEVGAQLATNTIPDDECFEAILVRLDDCLNRQDKLGRLRVIRDAKAVRPHLTAWFVGIEFTASHVDGAVAARQAAMEIAAKSKATSTVYMTVKGDMNVESGGVAGVDNSLEKMIGTSNGQAQH